MTRRDTALRAGLLASTAFVAAMLANDAAQAACTPAAADDVTAICTGITNNQGPLANVGYGEFPVDNLNVTVRPDAIVTGNFAGIGLRSGSVTNSGVIAGGSFGLWSVNTTVTNSGTITGGSSGIQSTTTANVINSGTITGTTLYGIVVSAAVNLTNSGAITGGSAGILSGITNVTNSGTIAGDRGIVSADSGRVTTSGAIIGSGGTAIQFNQSGIASSDSLTILPGARFGGMVDFGGGADTVNFGPGSWILNTAQFDAALSTVATGGNPFFVTPNRIVVADLSGFGAMNRAVMDITSWIASVLPDTPVFEPAPQTNAASAFAAIDAAAPRFDDAFAKFPSALPYAPTPVFKGGTVNYGDGNSIWAKGFGGHRGQQTDGGFLGSVTRGYGGAIGYDRQVTANTRLGAFIGASTNETDIDLNIGGIDTDTLFGGVYARSFFGANFLDLALIGGTLDNESKRNIGGGLSLETARASYDGWFVNPTLTLGHRFAFGHGLTVTPALKLRYVAARFDGYAESGSSANLTVGGRTVQALEERAELTLANVRYVGDSRITFRMTAGALAQQRTGDTNVNIALIGQTFIAETPDQKNVFGLYGGAGLDWQIGRVALFASGEITGTDDSTTTVSGKGGLRVVF